MGYLTVSTQKRSPLKRVLTGGLFAVLTACAAGPVFASDDITTTAGFAAVKGVLMERHFAGDMDRLEKAAGSEEELVASLLVLRHVEDVPFVAIRAERLLLDFSAREDVQAALTADLQSANYKGLARTVVIHIDAVKDASVRHKLARVAVERSRTEADFAPYVRSLESSSDSVVRSLAAGDKPTK